MKRFMLATTALIGFAIMPAMADTIDDPLHGLVCSSATSCTNAGDNGSFTPLASAANFGFSISPGPATGNLELVIGVPTNEINTGTFVLPGLTDNSSGTTSTVFSRTNFFNAASASGTGVLSTYLGLGAFSPTDNFSNLSAGTTANDSGFGGNFLVFTVTLSNVVIGDNASCGTICATTQDFSFGSNLPGGSFITGLFVETAPNMENVGTAASAHLVQTAAAPVPGPIAGAGIPGFFGLLMLGLARFRQKRNEWRRMAQASA
jgi:hypothetical protein